MINAPRASQFPRGFARVPVRECPALIVRSKLMIVTVTSGEDEQR